MPVRAMAAASPRSAPTPTSTSSTSSSSTSPTSAPRGARVVIAGWTEGSLDRLLPDAGRAWSRQPQAGRRRWRMSESSRRGRRPRPCCRSKPASRPETSVVIGEQDILGDRLVRRSKRRKRASDFIAEATVLVGGDIVVHADHGIGRFIGLRTIEAVGAPHDCLEIHYADDDRALPAGREHRASVALRLGRQRGLSSTSSAAAPGSRARRKLKKRLLDMAGQLIRIAAERLMRARAGAGAAPDGLYDEFAARFPYEETEDQHDGHRGGARRSRRRAGRWTGCLRRRRLRQDRSGAARRLRRGDERGTGGGRRADDAARRASISRRSRTLLRPADPVAQASRLVGAKELARPRRASPTARSISSSARMRCSAPASPSAISAC